MRDTTLENGMEKSVCPLTQVFKESALYRCAQSSVAKTGGMTGGFITAGSGALDFLPERRLKTVLALEQFRKSILSGLERQLSS